MRALWRFAAKDLRRMLRDTASLLIWIAIPFSVLALLNLAFGGGSGPRPKNKLYIADQDDSLLSRAVPMAFRQGPLEALFDIEQKEEQAGRALLGADKGSALIVIPKGFGQAALRNQPVALTLVKNPSQQLLPNMVEETLVLGADAMHYLHMVAGQELQAFAEFRSQPPLPDVLKMSTSFYRLAEELGPYLDPPLIGYEIKAPAKEARPALDFRRLFFGGMLFLSMLFIARGSSGDIWVEHRQGTLRRLAATPQPLWLMLTGKAVAATSLAAVVTAVLVVVCRWIAGLAIQQTALAVAWTVLCAAGMYALMTVLHLLGGGETGGDVLTTLAVFPMAIIGGGFFPLEVLPSGLASIGRLTPLGWMVSRFHEITRGDISWTGMLVPALILVSVGLLLLLASVLLVRRRLVRA